jgi:hypothetical protein
MREQRICLAGIEPGSKQHLRPVADSDNPLGRDLLAESGGPLGLGAVVDLGETRARPAPPAIEDREFQPDRARRIGQLSPDEYTELLEAASHRSLREAFGPDLQRCGPHTYAADPGHGDRSLACVRLRRRSLLWIDDFGLQLAFEEVSRTARIRITDLRFFEEDQSTLRYALIDDVSARLKQGTRVWVMFGLGRAWKVREDQPERHWLQVNGLCLEDRPLGPLP